MRESVPLHSYTILFMCWALCPVSRHHGDKGCSVNCDCSISWHFLVISFVVFGSAVFQALLIVQPVFPQVLNNSYTMGCPPVRGDNPRASASGLSYVQVNKHSITTLYHLPQCRP